MKKGLLAIAAGMFLLVSCNQSKDASSADGDYMAKAKMNSERNKDIYTAIESGDMSKLDSFITKDVVDHEGNMGKDIVGLDSLKYYLGNMHNYMEGLKMDIVSEGTSLDGVYHFSLVRMRGKAKANPWGMPVGKDIDDTGVDVVKIKDGKASEHWAFTSQKAIGEMMASMQGGGMPPMKKDNMK